MNKYLQVPKNIYLNCHLTQLSVDAIALSEVQFKLAVKEVFYDC